MMDILDVLCPHPEKTLTGTFYPRKSATDGGVGFDYEPVDPTSRRYQMAFANVGGSAAAMTTVKTKQPLPFNESGGVLGYAVLQDGKLYCVLSVSNDYSSVSKELYRFLGEAAGVDTVLHLSEEENPWGLS